MSSIFSRPSFDFPTPVVRQPHSAPVPINERARLEALRGSGILDTLAEDAFDEIVAHASEICGTPISAVTLIDEHRQWNKATVGLDPGEAPRSVSFCAHTILERDLLVVEDALLDHRFANNPMVLGDPSIRFYAGAALRNEQGLAMGALCVIDRVPRVLTKMQTRALSMLAHQVEAQLQLRAQLHAAKTQQARLERLEAQKEELRSLLVHDLKSPLASILPTTRFLMSHPVNDDERRSALRDIESSAEAMYRMVLDLLDVSRGQEGLLTPKLKPVDLRRLLTDLHRTLLRRAGHARRKVEITFRLTQPSYRTDEDLVRRVLENLVDNALKYTAEDIVVSVEVNELPTGGFECLVRDSGEGIAESQRMRIFDKYTQINPERGTHASLGLGLRFCKLAVTALGGTITAGRNEPQGACFTVVLPG